MSSVDETTGKLNILVAYPYLKPAMVEEIRAAGPSVRFVLDSGAFTAWKSGKPIALDDYCKFIEKLPIVPWRYFSLDVIGDPHASLKNYEEMLRRGFAPVPVFTRGEDPSVLDDYYKHSDVVGIGGLVGTPKNKAFVNGIMRRVRDRRVHWLGFTNIEFIKQYRPYMCDSSSWENGARYACIRLYMGNGKIIPISKVNFQTRPDQKIIERVIALGGDPYALATNGAWAGNITESRTLGGASGVALSLDIERNLKTKMFIALGSLLFLNILIEKHNFLQTRREA